jgi:hypothetical protein
MLGEKVEWINQLNCYAALERKFHNKQIDELVVECILRDWRRSEIFKFDNYPKIPWHTIQSTVKDSNDAMEYLMRRVELHKECKSMEFETLPVCTEAEMWERPSRYAVIKQGASKATRVLDTALEAEKYLLDKKLGSQYNVVRRAGERVKCLSFCKVRSVCPYAVKPIDQDKED